MRRLLVPVAISALLAACSSSTDSSTPAVPDRTTYAYSLVAPAGASPSGLVARAVLPGGSTCPKLDVTGAQAVVMQQRQLPATADGAFKDVLVCSAPIPSGATAASVDGLSIPAAMPAQVQTIAAIADTGCMIFKTVVQDCNSAKDWPFAALAGQVAAAKPDLIIHDGDYFYRETACPASDGAKCGNSPAPLSGVPFLDSGAGWLVDFFEPAKAMLATAPLVAVRGNHEICKIAGNGFFLFMDPRPDTAETCAPRDAGGKAKAPTVLTKPWKVDVRGSYGDTLRLAIVDSSHGWGYGQSPWWPRLRPGYERANAWAKDKTVRTFLVTHQPSLGITTTDYRPRNFPDWVPWVGGDQYAASHDLLRNYAAIFSGHLHLSEVVKIPGLPPQFIVGGGGTRLDRPTGYTTPKYGPLANSKGKPVLPGVKPYPPADYRWTEVQHAFGLVSPSPADGSWNVRYIKPDNSVLADCQVGSNGDPSC